MSHEDAELVAVASFSQRFEADLAASRLEAAGIQSLVSGPDAGGTLMAIPGGIRVLVHHADLEAASAVLRPELAARESGGPKGMKPIHWLALAFVVASLAWILVQAFRNLGRV